MSVKPAKYIAREPLVWIDLETSGLDCDKDCILEIACLVTDGDLKNVRIGPSVVVSRSKETMDAMGEWCTVQHRSSGLTKDVLASTVSIEEAEKTVLDFVKKYVPVEKIALLAGSSVHFDKEFLRKEMPNLFKHLHYRIIDVSTVGELVKRWSPNILLKRPRKQGSDHRAMSDIQDSLRELLFYQEHAFKMGK